MARVRYRGDPEGHRCLRGHRRQRGPRGRHVSHQAARTPRQDDSYLDKGAVLLGSANLEDYPVTLPEKPTSKDLCRSLLYAGQADGLTIDGAEEIDERCKSLTFR
jgi:hypothetical protein